MKITLIATPRIDYREVRDKAKTSWMAIVVGRRENITGF